MLGVARALAAGTLVGFAVWGDSRIAWTIIFILLFIFCEVFGAAVIKLGVMNLRAGLTVYTELEKIKADITDETELRRAMKRYDLDARLRPTKRP